MNGSKPSADDGDAESELSDPDSNVNSPGLHGLADEIVVSNRDDRDLLSSPLNISDDGDETMADAREEYTSPYPKRRRAPTFNDSYDSRADQANGEDKGAGLANGKVKTPKPNVGGVKGVTIGYWRDAPVPEEERKHAVIGFIDVRDRLRTRIQPTNLLGEQISLQFALPPGPGGSWVTFERIVFLDHLIGLDQSQIKEYVRIRAEVREGSHEDQAAAEKAAAKDAVTRVKNNPTDNPAAQPQIAYGLKVPDYASTPGNRQDAKRRKLSAGFTSITPTPAEQAPTQRTVEPLPGRRPTRILLGYWSKSDEVDPRNRHAVYGILGHNDMFRVKLVRETRDGRFVDGNFPQGAGALWIAYEEVHFEDHLQDLTRAEIKEYCRVRQFQIDKYWNKKLDEPASEREPNERKAVIDAQERALLLNNPSLPKHNFALSDNLGTQSAPDTPTLANGTSLGLETRTSRRTEARLLAQAQAQAQDTTQTLPDRSGRETRPEVRQRRSAGGVETPPVGRGNVRDKATALAQREIQRVEAAQRRADVYATHRERAAAVAVQEADAAAAAPTTTPTARPNGTAGPTLASAAGDLDRLNSVWARQEHLRMRAVAEDAKIYDGRKYERKSNGPFVGKLASQGSLINIDGEDYIEYRVLMKPAFY